ncbi:hypothetical protein [Acaryochloris sp. IP29b_bin.137]|uniref:hypothetical protein n=1 Tax=Acaryochloris sp. IP29b_bin.137 TaxID=2969217 RepID=UPI002629D747|nr:hypothetical protein [Acaryochloris sp. IP29b_bin.137]
MASPLILGVSSLLLAQPLSYPHQLRQQYLLQQRLRQKNLQQPLKFHRQLRLYQHRQIDEFLNQRRQQLRQQLKQRQQHRDIERKRFLQQRPIER